MAVNKIKAVDVADYELHELDGDPEFFALTNGDMHDTIFDQVERINEKLAAHGLVLLTGLDDGQCVFAKLVQLEKDAFQPEQAGWICDDSPTGRCIYEDDLDECTYCGDPEERK